MKKMACPDPSSLSNSALLVQKHLVRCREGLRCLDRERERMKG